MQSEFNEKSETGKIMRMILRHLFATGVRRFSGNKSGPRSQSRLATPMRRRTGGEGGIRTPDRLAPMPHFECGAIDHSATSPGAMTGGLPPSVGRSSWGGGRGRQGGEGEKIGVGRAPDAARAAPPLRGVVRC